MAGSIEHSIVPHLMPTACTNCKKKKLKCSQTDPCTNCINKKIPCTFDLTQSFITFGIKRDYKKVLKGCDECLSKMYVSKNWSCDLLMPCFHCLENGYDCKYDKYLGKIKLYDRFSLKSDDEEDSKEDSKDLSNNSLSLKKKLLKTYILNNYINSDNVENEEFLEMLNENEIFLQKRLLDEENDNTNEDFEILQLFQDYTYWIMKKAFFQGIILPNKGYLKSITINQQFNYDSNEIFDMFDFYTMKVLITYAIENLGFMFLGLFYNPIDQIITKPDILNNIFSENGSIETLDSVLDELIIRSICLLSIHYMSDSDFYQLTEVSSLKKANYYNELLNKIMQLFNNIQHFEDVRIIQTILILAQTDLHLKWPKKFSWMMNICINMMKILNLDRSIRSFKEDYSVLKFIQVQKNIYFKVVYLSCLFQNQLQTSNFGIIQERHSYDFRRMHLINEIDENTNLSFENFQFKIGLFLKEFHDREMLMHGHGIAKHYSYTSEKLSTFKSENINSFLNKLDFDNLSTSNLGEYILINIEYYFLNFKLVKYKFINSDKTDLSATVSEIKNLFLTSELFLESLLDITSEKALEFQFYKYPSVLICISEVASFHALYKIFNKSERNLKIYNNILEIISLLIKTEMTRYSDIYDDNDDSSDHILQNNDFLKKLILLNTLLDRLNSIQTYFDKKELINKSITENLPYLILKEDIFTISSNFDERIPNLVPGMSTSIRNDLHSYSLKLDSKSKIGIITSFRENLYTILASFKDFI